MHIKLYLHMTEGYVRNMDIATYQYINTKHKMDPRKHPKFYLCNNNLYMWIEYSKVMTRMTGGFGHQMGNESGNIYNILAEASSILVFKWSGKRDGKTEYYIEAYKDGIKYKYQFVRTGKTIYHVMDHNLTLQAQIKELRMDLELERCKNAHIEAFKEINRV